MKAEELAFWMRQYPPDREVVVNNQLGHTFAVVGTEGDPAENRVYINLSHRVIGKPVKERNG